MLFFTEVIIGLASVHLIYDVETILKNINPIFSVYTHSFNLVVYASFKNNYTK